MKKIFLMISLISIVGCGRGSQVNAAKYSDLEYELSNRVYKENCEEVRHRILEKEATFDGKAVGQDLYAYMKKKDMIPILKAIGQGEYELKYEIESIVPCSDYWKYYLSMRSFFNPNDESDAHIEDIKKILNMPIIHETKQLLDRNRLVGDKEKRVLILDSGHFTVSDVYASSAHILDAFDIDSDSGKLVPINFTIESSNRFELLLQTLSAFKKPWSHPLAFSLYSQIQRDISYDSLYETHVSHHISNVFNFISNMTPSAQVAFAPFPTSEIKPEFYDNFEVEKINELYKNYFDSLKEYVITNNINYINISQAIKDNNAGSGIKTKKGFDLFRDKFMSFVKKIANELDVIVFLALPNDLRSSIEFSEVGKYYCQDVPRNIIRVSYMSNNKVKIGRDGIKFSVGYFDKYQNKNINCSDIYINSYINEDKVDSLFSTPSITRIQSKWWNNSSPILMLSGIAMPMRDLMATSWATPLSLSLFLEMFSDFKKPNKTDLMSKILFIESYMKGKIFDPIKNRQLEVFKNNAY